MQLYLAADDADGVAIEAGWSLMLFCSLAARTEGHEILVVLSLQLWGLWLLACIFDLQWRFAADGGG